jgi:hypothetical protein
MIDPDMLNHLYSSTEIPLQFFEQEKPVWNCGCGFQPNPAVSIMQSIIAMNQAHRVCYTISPEFLHCGLVRLRDSPEYLVVGPAPSFECTRGRVLNILAGMGQPEANAPELLHWLGTIPLCNTRRFRSTLLFMDYLLNGSREQTAVYLPCPPDKVSPPADEAALFAWKEHVSDSMEKQLLSCVEYGRTDELERIFEEWGGRASQTPKVAPNPVRAIKNIFIAATGIVSRAALHGGGGGWNTGL